MAPFTRHNDRPDLRSERADRLDRRCDDHRRRHAVEPGIAPDAEGAGIASDADGAGINSPLGSLTLKSSTVTGNRAIASAPNGRFADSGGIFAGSGTTLTVDNSR